jgi:arginine deiminase
MFSHWGRDKLENLPGVKSGLEVAGCSVTTYKGLEISRKGEGGPTCLTRPLERG